MSELLTQRYLRTRLWLAGITVGLSMVIAIVVGWQALSSFKAHALYSKLFTDLIQATSQFESEMSRPTSSDETAAAQARLVGALDNVANITALMSSLTGPEGHPQAATATTASAADLRNLRQRYGLKPGTMPEPLRAVWQERDVSGATLETALSDLAVFGRQLAEIEDRGSAKYHAISSYLRNQVHQSIWPAYHRALDSISTSTALTAQAGIYLLGLCALVLLGAAVLNTVFIFIPLVGTVMRSQDELVHERDRALASEKAKREFLAMMSHELRTPMNGVLGFANMLLSCDLPPKQRDYAETIHSSGLTLLDLLNDILDISNIETGKLELETSDLSIEEVVAEVIALLAPQAFAKRLEIGAFIDPSLPEMLSGDVGRVRQILLKLTGNAIKFTEKGGIAIEVRHEGVRVDGDHDIRFAVIDTGIGVQPGQIGSIFDHFTQADSSNRRKYNGAGLGLPICRELVKLMDGKIGVDSTPGEGSTFWFRVRLADAVPPMEAIRDSAGGNLDGVRCLVVDDNALNRRIFQMQLESFGAEVDLAADANGAMHMLAGALSEGRPHRIAIIDHMMPDADGLVLRRMIREQPQYGPVKLIISSSGGISFDQQARALGFDAACPKPVMQDKLVRQMFALLKPLDAAVLPVNLANMQPSAAPGGGEPAEPKARLLVVEDNAINQRLIMGALQQAGYVVDLVGDGVEAVHAVQRLPYDVVLMDIRMPVMGGIEATRRIRSLTGPASRRPIIAMTANTMIGDREEYLQAGMNDYIAKPIDFPLLIGKIESYLVARTHASLGEDDITRQAPLGTLHR
ncbi:MULTISPECIES: response regulator [Rhodomicrobium]|uniref:hybrid sensor histidine kinase/response regulator n=1 Tax=Rhodomicrobium TaxID=1068 RepID=UPI000B4B98F5|nr:MULTISPECIES: response regulator [Rhodomicrobium]